MATGRPGGNISNTVKLADPENHTRRKPEITTLSYTQPKL